MKTVTINVTNRCNLLCDWCYAQEMNGNYELSIDDFHLFYENIIDNHFEVVSLVGGEPLLLSNFEEFISLLRHKNILITTNGCLISQKNIYASLEKVDNLTINVSLKGYNRESFYRLTSKDDFSDLEKTLEMLKFDKRIQYSYIINPWIEESEYDKILCFLENYNFNKLIISDTRPYFRNQEVIKELYSDKFEKCINYLYERYNNFFVRINNPFCHYSKDFVKYYLSNKKLISSCGIKSCSGLFFSHNLELILCNQFNKSFGKFKIDFSSYDEMLSTIRENGLGELYEKIHRSARKECLTCDYYSKCGGGCLLYWF